MHSLNTLLFWLKGSVKSNNVFFSLLLEEYFVALSFSRRLQENIRPTVLSKPCLYAFLAPESLREWWEIKFWSMFHYHSPRWSAILSMRPQLPMVKKTQDCLMCARWLRTRVEKISVELTVKNMTRWIFFCMHLKLCNCLSGSRSS